MIRIIIFIAIAGLIIYAYRLITGSLGSKKCKNCDGKGYWSGTRGEKHACKDCSGTGRIG